MSPNQMEKPMIPQDAEATAEQQIDALVFNEIQILLAEKRTSLAAMRTGIAVIALPLSVLSILVATSKYYSIAAIMPLFAALIGLCIALACFGSYLIIRSLRRIHHYDRMILAIKQKYSRLADVLD